MDDNEGSATERGVLGDGRRYGSSLVGYDMDSEEGLDGVVPYSVLNKIIGAYS